MSRTSVTVLTTAIPKRMDMLGTCTASVIHQDCDYVKHHVIGIDHRGIGPGANLQSLWLAARALGTEFVIPVADDDVLYPDCIRLMVQAANKQKADVVHARADVTGRGEEFETWINRPLIEEQILAGSNSVPANSLIRTKLVEKLDGWKPNAAKGWEDLEFWQRALQAGAEFFYLDPGHPLWLYRFHGDNHSQGELKKIHG